MEVENEAIIVPDFDEIGDLKIRGKVLALGKKRKRRGVDIQIPQSQNTYLGR